MSQELSNKEISNALEKLKITPKTESSIKENSDNLDNALKTMILDTIDKLRGKYIVCRGILLESTFLFSL